MKEVSKISSSIVNDDTPLKQKKSYEISPEAQEERQLLTAFLLDQKEELIKERNRRKEKIEAEKIELRSGKIISRTEIMQFVTSLKQTYSAKFPNDNPFFTNMFRLHPKLAHLDPKKFEKPPLAGRLLKQLTYDRFKVEFAVEVLPALQVLAMPGGIRFSKCHEYLTSEGAEHLLRFRDDANEMMSKFEDLQWYEFRKEFCTKYKLAFQPRLL